MRFIKPPRLKSGEVIGIISPASSVQDPSLLNKGVRYIENNGYRVEVGKSVDKIKGYLAGDDEERTDDLNQMFKNKNVKAIICVRGGYGSGRIIDKINYKLIRNNPKILVGYSDITALQMAISKKTGLITFAGPMLASDFADRMNPESEDFFWRLITSKKKIGRLSFADNNKLPAINKGSAVGRIIGGNLSVLSSLIGTPYFPELKDKILLMEDIDEIPYRIDRLLNQMRLNNVFKQVKGILLGRFVDCYEHDPEKKTLTLGEVMEDYLQDLKIPVIYSFPHGHIKEKITVPFGIKVKINASRGFVEYEESAVR
ncbi:MAG: LD-carboxypeptidase [Ignavibacteriaceae bacterium]